MGGSGGGGPVYNPGTLDRVLSDATKAHATYEAELSQYLSALLADANDRDTDTTRAQLDAIKAALERGEEGFVTLLFGGSVSKQTWVRELSDVDALVFLDESDLGELSPDQVCERFAGNLRAKLPQTVIDRDGFAVDVRFSDGLIQLIPARRDGDSVLIPSEDCTTWVRTWPDRFRQELTDVNQQCNRRVVPVIKLTKMLLAGLPEDRRPTGHHVEALAVEAFRSYAENFTTKAMLRHLLHYAQGRVLAPVQDESGQSQYLDANLGPASSLPRQLLSDVFGRLTRRIQLADARGSLAEWHELFDG